MFGYVKPVLAELRVKDHEFYKAAYCGVCRAMQKHTGALSAVSLSYDSVLLAIVRMLYVEDGKISARKRRCLAHPIKSRTMLDENPALEYTARAFAIFTYYKLLDDIKDERKSVKFKVSPIVPAIKRGKRLAGIKDVEEIIKNGLLEIEENEKNGSGSVDDQAELFGKLLGEVFAYGLSGADRTVIYTFGRRLGRFILCADAAEDYEEDLRTGKYNPYIKLYGGKELTFENKQTIKRALMLECVEMEKAVDLMPFGNRLIIENTVRNIIYLGLPKRIEFLDRKEGS